MLVHYIDNINLLGSDKEEVANILDSYTPEGGR